MAADVDRDVHEGAAGLPLGFVRRRRRDALRQQVESEGGGAHAAAGVHARLAARPVATSFPRNCPHAAAISRPFDLRTVTATPLRTSVSTKWSIAASVGRFIQGGR